MTLTTNRQQNGRQGMDPRTDRAIDARLSALLQAHNGRNLYADTVQESVDGLTGHYTRNCLALWLTAYFAAGCKRPSLKISEARAHRQMYDDRVNTPEVRAIRRAHRLLIRLITGGCLRRGEIGTTQAATTNGKDLLQ